MGYQVCGVDIELVHGKMLLIAKEIDRICRKNNINYILDGGSMLGAIRHGGFIPWDHDFDCAMLRKDYNKFIKACKKDLGEEFFLSTYNSECRYPYNFAKLRLNNTVFTEYRCDGLPIHQGIFVDIFPIDNVVLPLKNVQCNLTRIFRCAVEAKNGMEVDGERAKKYAKYIGIMPLTVLNFLRDISMRLFNWMPTKYVYKVCHPGSMKPYYERSMYTDLIDYKFEDWYFRIPRKYDEFLSKRFGEYMKLPPESERSTGDRSVKECVFKE